MGRLLNKLLKKIQKVEKMKILNMIWMTRLCTKCRNFLLTMIMSSLSAREKPRSIEAKILGMKVDSREDMITMLATDLMQSTEVLLHHNLVILEGTQVLPEDIKVIILGQLLININLGLVRGLHTTALSSTGQSRCTVKSPLAGRVRSR